MRKFVPLAVAAAWLTVIAGAAMAQSYPEGPLPPTGPSSLAITTDSEGPLPGSVVGKSVWSNRNDRYGVIVGTKGDALIVRTGNAMHLVPRDHLYAIGSGPGMRVGTAMTAADLAALPKYRPPRTTATR